MPILIDHIDLRVRDRAVATAFYDAFLSQLGAVMTETEEFTTWRIPAAGGAAGEAPDNFGITQELQHVAGSVRIAFRAMSRDAVDTVAAVLGEIGAPNVEMDDGIYGDDYYGVFFDDPDGNRLEVCFQT